MNKVFLRNSVKCLHCFKTIESKHVHDYVTCTCGKVSVDGGLDYIRVIGNDNDWQELWVYAKVGMVLYTRDGRKIGNAVIIKINSNNTVDILTDFGNYVKNLTPKEINLFFYLGNECDINVWLQGNLSRYKFIKKIAKEISQQRIQDI